MRVRARWAASPPGSISDIACFEPCAVPAAAPAVPVTRAGRGAGDDDHHAGPAALRAHRRRPGRATTCAGWRQGGCSASAARPAARSTSRRAAACPTDGVPTTDEVELPDTGTVTTFCVVNVPFPGQRVHTAVRGGVGAARRRRHPLPAPGPGLRARRGPDGHAGRGGLAAQRGVGHHGATTSTISGRPASRTHRTRPTPTICERTPAVTGVAVVGFAQSPVRAPRRRHHQRRRDAGADLRPRCSPAPGWPRTTSGSGARVPRTTWPAGRSRSSRRSTRSARSRRSWSRTWRWTAPGRCTRPG